MSVSAPGAAKRRLSVPLRLAPLLALLGLVGLKLLLYVAAAHGNVSALCQFDCYWYVHTAEAGYDLHPPPQFKAFDPANWAFFPLYPLLSRALMSVTLLSGFWSATAVAALCFIGFAALSVHYRRLTRPGGNDLTWIVLLLVYPYSLYFVVPYSESTYLLVTILLLLAVNARAWLGAGLATALLTATRPTGVLAIPYLALAALWRERASFRPGRIAENLPRLAHLLLGLAVMPLGIGLYMAYLYWLTGDALAFEHVQAVWGRTFANPVKTLCWELAVNDWSVLLHAEGPESRSYDVVWAIPAALGCVWLLLRRLPFEAWLLGSAAVLALGSGSISLPRIIAANPVFLLLVGDVADQIRSRPLRAVLALLCVGLQAVLLHRWMLGSRLMM